MSAAADCATNDSISICDPGRLSFLIPREILTCVKSNCSLPQAFSSNLHKISILSAIMRAQMKMIRSDFARLCEFSITHYNRLYFILCAYPEIKIQHCASFAFHVCCKSGVWCFKFQVKHYKKKCFQQCIKFKYSCCFCFPTVNRLKFKVHILWASQAHLLTPRSFVGISLLFSFLLFCHSHFVNLCMNSSMVF